jgi:hypothetical protein
MDIPTNTRLIALCCTEYSFGCKKKLSSTWGACYIPIKLSGKWNISVQGNGVSNNSSTYFVLHSCDANTLLLLTVRHGITVRL